MVILLTGNDLDTIENLENKFSGRKYFNFKFVWDKTSIISQIEQFKIQFNESNVLNKASDGKIIVVNSHDFDEVQDKVFKKYIELLFSSLGCFYVKCGENFEEDSFFEFSFDKNVSFLADLENKIKKYKNIIESNKCYKNVLALGGFGFYLCDFNNILENKINDVFMVKSKSSYKILFDDLVHLIYSKQYGMDELNAKDFIILRFNNPSQYAFTSLSNKYKIETI